MISKQYLAGFIDGEGYIGVTTHRDSRTKRGFTLQSSIMIGNTDKYLLKEIKKIVGGRIYIRNKIRKNKKLYVLQIHNFENIIRLLKYISKHLIIKKEQSTLLLEYCKSRMRHKKGGYTDREFEIAQLFKTINTRGDNS